MTNMKKWKKLILLLACLMFTQLSAEMLTTPVMVEAATVTSGLKKENGKYYYYYKGKKVKNTWKTVNGYRYYFGSNDAAYAGKVEYGEKVFAYKKISGKYYGFDKYARMQKGDYVRYGKIYSFNKKNGVYDSKRTAVLRKAAKYETNAATIRKLLGKPLKVKKVSGCYSGQEYYWYYKNMIVNVADKNSTKVVLGVFPR